MVNVEQVYTSYQSFQNYQEQRQSAVEISTLYHQGVITHPQANEMLFKVFDENVHAYQGRRLEQLTQIVQKIVGIENLSVEGVEIDRGWSTSGSYWIKDRASKERLFFLKTFATDDLEFLPEIFGLSFLKNVKDVTAPEVLVIGQCVIDSTPHFYMIQNIVEGKSITQYYYYVNQYSAGTQERKDAVSLLCQAVKACGQSLASLHSHYAGTYQPLSKQVEEEMLTALDKAVLELEVNPQQGIEIEKLKKAVAESIQQMKTDSHLTGVTHGDIKMAHVFYDASQNRISLIDTSRLSFSLDAQGTPQDLPAHEYYRFQRSLILNRIGYALNEENHVVRLELLNEEELAEVKDAFQNGYVACGGILPTVAEEDFGLLRHNLSFVSNASRNLPEPDLTRLKDLLVISLEDLHRRFER